MPAASEPEIELFVPCEPCDGTGLKRQPPGAEPLFCRACGGEGENVERITLRRLSALLAADGRIDAGAADHGDDEIVALEHIETDAFADREQRGHRFVVRNPEGTFPAEQQAYTSERRGNRLDARDAPG